MTGIEIVGVALVAIVAAGLGVACWAQRREIERLAERGDIAWRQRDQYKQSHEEREAHTEALLLIAAATATGKSGTARKVHRMATEALAEQERIAANG